MWPSEEADRSRLESTGAPKQWAPIESYNPDRNRSASATYLVDRGSDVLWILQVKGLGVITLRASSSWTSDTGKLKFEGCGIFTKADIGYSPDL